GVEVALRAYPDVVPDAAEAVEAALDVRLGADEDSVPDLERLEVLEAGPGADLDAVPEGGGACAPYDASHHGVEGALALGEAGVEVEQPLGLARPRDVLGQADLDLRVGLGPPQAVDGADYAVCHA